MSTIKATAKNSRSNSNKELQSREQDAKMKENGTNIFSYSSKNVENFIKQWTKEPGKDRERNVKKTHKKGQTRIKEPNDEEMEEMRSNVTATREKDSNKKASKGRTRPKSSRSSRSSRSSAGGVKNNNNVPVETARF